MLCPVTWHRPGGLTAFVLCVAIAMGAAVGYLATVTLLPGTLAIFTDPGTVDGTAGTARIFRDERVTPAFAVSDFSSGTEVDASSATAFADDGRYIITRPWTPTFDATRYLEFDLNAPLPAGLSVESTQLALGVASNSPNADACYYVELRRASDGALLSTHGSAGSPLDCVNGTAPQTRTAPLPAVAGTDLANDLRVRLVATDSSSGGLRVEALTVNGTTPYVGFTLYPILTRDVDDDGVELIRWGLAGP